jgi:hypothetical protein
LGQGPADSCWETLSLLHVFICKNVSSSFPSFSMRWSRCHWAWSVARKVWRGCRKRKLSCLLVILSASTRARPWPGTWDGWSHTRFETLSILLLRSNMPRNCQSAAQRSSNTCVRRYGDAACSSCDCSVPDHWRCFPSSQPEVRVPGKGVMGEREGTQRALKLWEPVTRAFAHSGSGD